MVEIRIFIPSENLRFSYLVCKKKISAGCSCHMHTEILEMLFPVFIGPTCTIKMLSFRTDTSGQTV